MNLEPTQMAMEILNFRVLRWLLLLFILHFWIPSTKAEDLLCVYELALANDPTIRAAKAAQLAAQEACPQAYALFMPVISGNASNIYYNKSYQATNLQLPTFTIPLNQTKYFYDQTVIGLTLNQPVFYYHQWVQLAKAGAQVCQANATFASAEQDLIVRTIQAYLNVLRAMDALKFAQTERKALANILEQTEARYKAGVLSTRADVELARARHVSAYSQEISAQNDLAVQKQLLKEITCEKIECFDELREEVCFTPPFPEAMEEWICKAIEQNLDLIALRYQVEYTREDVKLNRGDHLPKINITGAVTRSTGTQDIFPYPKNITSYIGVQVNMPLFSGGSVISKSKQARYIYEQNQSELEALHRQVESKTSKSYLGVITELHHISAYQESVKSNRMALEATQASYTAGTRTIVDVLNAQSDLIKSEQDYANARYDYIVERILLKQATGMLCPEDIYMINSWLKTS